MNSTSESAGGRSPDEIAAEIDVTRERIRETAGALHDRLSPREQLGRAAESVSGTVRRFADQASQAAGPWITTMIRLDHTHVLALFRRCRPFTSAARKRALVENACLALEVHARLEEEIFYPALREVIGSNELLEKSVPEHDEMRDIIAELSTMDPTDAGYDDRVHALMRVVLHHVADEESVLLPLAEERMPERLGALGMQMTRRRAELLKPHLAEVTRMTVRSFPLATAAVAVGALAIVWAVLRPNRGARTV